MLFGCIISFKWIHFLHIYRKRILGHSTNLQKRQRITSFLPNLWIWKALFLSPLIARDTNVRLNMPNSPEFWEQSTGLSVPILLSGATTAFLRDLIVPSLEYLETISRHSRADKFCLTPMHVWKSIMEIVMSKKNPKTFPSGLYTFFQNLKPLQLHASKN
jgi:hypothetical protein